MVVRLIVDDREHTIFGLLPIGDVVVERKRITVGDFAIAIDDVIVATIERKTLDDYGASIIDGRSANRLKMLDLQSETQTTQVYYVVEGDLMPSPDTEYGHVKYSSIEASIIHLTTEYGIYVWRTKGARQTADWLIKLARSFAARPPRRIIVMTPGTPSGSSEAPNAEQTRINDLLTRRVEKTVGEYRLDLWQALPGFGPTAALICCAFGSPLTVLMATYEGKPIKTEGRGLTESQIQTLRDLLLPGWNHMQEIFLEGLPQVNAKTVTKLRAQFTCLRGVLGAACVSAEHSKIKRYLDIIYQVICS